MGFYGNKYKKMKIRDDLFYQRRKEALKRTKTYIGRKGKTESSFGQTAFNYSRAKMFTWTNNLFYLGWLVGCLVHLEAHSFHLRPSLLFAPMFVSFE
jgi:hypothetical protein